MDYSQEGSSIHKMLQARILEWVVIPLSRASSQGLNPSLLHCRQILYQLSYQGSPANTYYMIAKIGLHFFQFSSFYF